MFFPQKILSRMQINPGGKWKIGKHLLKTYYLYLPALENNYQEAECLIS
jgi:hypothetical protein